MSVHIFVINSNLWTYPFLFGTHKQQTHRLKEISKQTERQKERKRSKHNHSQRYQRKLPSGLYSLVIMLENNLQIIEYGKLDGKLDGFKLISVRL